VSRVVSIVNLSLDGVMQAPGRADEDTRGGFEHGGWAAPYQAMGSLMGRRTGETRGMLFGRRTYEDFAGFWPNQPDNPYTEVLDNAQKYVASRTLEEPLPWVNSTLLEGDAAGAVAALREEPGGDLVMLGSGDLAQSLMPRGLVDEYALLIHPLVLGSGRRLFGDAGPPASLELVDSETTPTGVVIATYRPAGA
jgi:dihydrofolate reductase